MKKLFTLALVVAVLSVGGVVLANDATTAATTDKAAKAGKHVGLDKQLTELQAKKDALVKADANADTKEIDAKIEELKTKIAKKAGKKGAKKADKAAADTTAAAPAAQ
ncbi:MAG: hypothetical protein WCI51_14715 [Lentisphaerota bacterium]